MERGRITFVASDGVSAEVTPKGGGKVYLTRPSRLGDKPVQDEEIFFSRQRAYPDRVEAWIRYVPDGHEETDAELSHLLGSFR